MHHDELRTIGDADPTPRRADEVRAVILDDEALLLDPRTDRIHQLNQQATLLWSVLDGEGTVGELVEDVADAFGIDGDDVRDDVHVLLEQLAAFDLVAGTEPPPHLLVGAPSVHRDEEADDGLWRPSYLFDPPAP